MENKRNEARNDFVVSRRVKKTCSIIFCLWLKVFFRVVTFDRSTVARESLCGWKFRSEIADEVQSLTHASSSAAEIAAVRTASDTFRSSQSRYSGNRATNHYWNSFALQTIWVFTLRYPRRNWLEAISFTSLFGKCISRGSRYRRVNIEKRFERAGAGRRGKES